MSLYAGDSFFDLVVNSKNTSDYDDLLEMVFYQFKIYLQDDSIEFYFYGTDGRPPEFHVIVPVELLGKFINKKYVF